MRSTSFPLARAASLALLPAVVATWTPQAHAGYFARAEAVAYLCEDPTACSSTLSSWPSNLAVGSFFERTPWQAPPTQVAIGNGGSFETFTLSSSASADLAAGSLRAAARIENSETTQGRTAFASATAWIGDSFTFNTAQGSPFAWGANGRATLNIDLDGVLNNTTIDPWAVFYGVQFAVRQHGAIQSSQGIPLTPLGQFVWSQWSTVHGPGGYDGSSSGTLPITALVSGSLEAGDLSLQLSFQPGGDFDWDLVLYTDTTLTDVAGIKEADFSHTLNASFVAPTGAVVTSSSGVFPVTSAVPEPAGWALMLAGGVGVLALGRRRRGA